MDMLTNIATATNGTVPADALLTLVDMAIGDMFVYPVFVTGTLTYLIIMICNSLVLASISVCKQLHTPMFILLSNLQIGDMMGATAFFPHFLFSVYTKNRMISFPACILQTFLIHVYGTGNLMILCAMAYDRYIAICHPLKYNTIITPNALLKIVVSIWLLSVIPVVTLLLMYKQLRFCKTNIVDFYCNNPSIVRLACGDTRIINYCGMSMTVFYQSATLMILLYSYGHIMRTCLITNMSETWKKATQTCGTHLAVYVVLVINLLITLISHRLEIVSPNMRKALGLSILIFPPLLDPLIYGLNTKQLKECMIMLLKRNFRTTK